MRPMLLRFLSTAAFVVLGFGVARGVDPPHFAGARVDTVGDPLPDHAIARFGTARFRDTGFVGGVALSPDGKLLAVSGNQEIRLLDTATGKELRRIKGQKPFLSIGTITFSPNGRFLAVADFSSVIVCDAVKGEVLSQFQPGSRPMQGSLSFSRDGKLLAVGGRGFREKLSVTIWDVVAKREKKRVELANDQQVHAALSPDGKMLATWGSALQRRADPVVTFHDLGTGKERFTLKPEGYMLQHVVFSPDRRHLATVEFGFPVSIRDLATGKLRTQFAASGNTMVVAYSPDGTRLATGSANGTVQLWDALSGRRFGQCEAPPQTQFSSLAFLPGNKVLAAGLSHQMLRLWEVPSGRERTPAISHLGAVSSLAFSHDGQILFSAGGDGVRVLSPASGKEIRRIELPLDESGRQLHGRGSRPRAFLSPDGRYLLWPGQTRGRLTVLHLASGEEIADLLTDGSPLIAASWAFAPRSARFASLGTGWPGKHRQVVARVVDLESGLLVRTITVSSTAFDWALALSPGGKVLAVAPTQRFRQAGTEKIALWDLATGKERTRLPILSADAMTFSPDGSLLATSEGGSISIWNTSDGEMVVSLRAAPGRFQQPLVFSPDGRLLAVVGQGPAADNDDICLCELASGKVRAKFPGHRGGTLALALSPDGRMLASGGADTTVMLWDVTGVTGLGGLARRKPAVAELAALWAHLDTIDAGKAHKAMARLMAAPAEAMALFRKELKSLRGNPPDEKEVQRLIADLGDESFEARQKATKALGEMDRAVRSHLLKALARTTDLERKHRLGELLRALTPGPEPEMIRPTRVLEVLERLATPEALHLLQTLAKGNPGTRLTSEAADTLKRLQRRR